MEFWESSGGETPSPGRKVELQGPRPSPLKINKDSHKITKKKNQPDPKREPVIIYSVSPKIIYTTSSDFMNLVQRLTGSSSNTNINNGDVSPAARIASVERTSSNNTRHNSQIMDQELDHVLTGTQMPAILSPAPSALPVIPSGFFSPAADLSWLNDLTNNMSSTSPSIYGGGHSNSMFVPSPSNLFSAPMVSPSPSSFHIILNHFFNF